MCRILDARCRATASAQALREGACAAWCLTVAQQAQEHALSLEEGFLLQPAAGRLACSLGCTSDTRCVSTCACLRSGWAAGHSATRNLASHWGDYSSMSTGTWVLDE